MQSLKEKYKKEVVPAMMKRFGYKNPMAVPSIKKVVLNSSFGKAVVGKAAGEREKIFNLISQDLSLIAGQATTIVKSKKSIAGFKLREGLEIAAVVTLRKQRMWDFLERLIYLSLPRSRDFKGLNPKSVDKNGNFSMGFKEHISFPEIFTEKEKTIFGLEITVVINAKTKEEGLELYKLMGFPMVETK
ncbi:MAG: 50S ribosomal protein L5 [Candidatus Staskawiczbacteria bacterium RIFOXYD1_FULL_39_28]|uniref:Large ribosomal subunit protein uL5 n=1 Tax=Candidatus Staskawiczbacteria bacterium RIFOXYC1_FULL_38_18 TaxID=1802229 RepID=A0A1G2JEF4_9BACT|nr:MAG: 50S ribosomal protein L5 [Candidatus Staskawiczbacteria bacterium RIFOXYC1_FULL_38_18]OGZ90276.1 MAG: 50S ribosomal protein L5 [Candidatus Staskawiczbacteria bacterium RIFOXYD1_FULL_39_28]